MEEKISLHGLWTATGRLELQLDRLLEPTQRDAANQRLAKHLRHERLYLFTFLYCPGLVDATNNVAERVMRILVMIRKHWGGNRKGAACHGDSLSKIEEKGLACYVSTASVSSAEGRRVCRDERTHRLLNLKIRD